MKDEKQFKELKNSEQPDVEIIPPKLNILITDADKNGNDISKMSDFMGLYAQQLTRSLADSSFAEVISSIPLR